MQIHKQQLKILKYINAKKNIQYNHLLTKFKKLNNLEEIMESLAYNQYVIQHGCHRNNLGEPIQIKPETMFSLSELGISEVENNHWFDTEYVVTHMLTPTVLAVISTLITLFLTHAL